MTAAEGEGSAPSGAGVFDRSLSWPSASGGPISFSSERNGEKNAAKNQWFLEFLWPISMRWEKVPRGIGHDSTLAAADRAHRESRRAYRLGRLSNRALAASGGKCRCGPTDRHFILVEQRTSRAERGSGSGERRISDSLYGDVRRFRFRGGRGDGFRHGPGAQEVLKPAVSSSSFGHFWGCGQK